MTGSGSLQEAPEKARCLGVRKSKLPWRYRDAESTRYVNYIPRQASERDVMSAIGGRPQESGCPSLLDLTCQYHLLWLLEPELQYLPCWALALLWSYHASYDSPFPSAMELFTLYHWILEVIFFFIFQRVTAKRLL